MVEHNRGGAVLCMLNPQVKYDFVVLNRKLFTWGTVQMACKGKLLFLLEKPLDKSQASLSVFLSFNV